MPQDEVVHLHKPTLGIIKHALPVLAGDRPPREQPVLVMVLAFIERELIGLPPQ
jgi:hypothetical protein